MTATATAPPTHPIRLPVAAGVTTACSVGSLALMTLGHGVAGWALMLAGGVLAAGMQLTVRVGEVRPRPRPAVAAGGLLLLLAAVLGGGLAARALVADHAWAAVVVALAAGGAAAAVLRRLQLRAGTAPA